MKMGIKEFRERVGEVAMGNEVVVLTHHGRRVGRYVPERTAAVRDLDLDTWLKKGRALGHRWRAATPDWREQLRAMGETDADIGALEMADRCC